jgi:hypothetical protein
VNHQIKKFLRQLVKHVACVLLIEDLLWDNDLGATFVVFMRGSGRFHCLGRQRMLGGTPWRYFLTEALRVNVGMKQFQLETC